MRAAERNRTMSLRCGPLCHHMLLTRHPACIELKGRHMQNAPVMAGLLTCGSQLTRTFPNVCPVVHIGVAHRSQLRGQLRIRRLFGLSSPHSLFILTAERCQKPSGRQNLKAGEASIQKWAKGAFGPCAPDDRVNRARAPAGSACLGLADLCKARLSDDGTHFHELFAERAGFPPHHPDGAFGYVAREM